MAVAKKLRQSFFPVTGTATSTPPKTSSPTAPIRRRLRLNEPVLVAIYLSPGVTAGAAGIVIINGKIKRVPPRGPATQQLIAAIQAVAGSATRR
jgi:hypothetical protein